MERFIEGQLIAFFNVKSLLEPMAVIGIIESIDDGILLIRYSQDRYMKVSVNEVYPVMNELFVAHENTT
jgi:hypothetical protein